VPVLFHLSRTAFSASEVFPAGCGKNHFPNVAFAGHVRHNAVPFRANFQKADPFEIIGAVFPPVWLLPQ